MWKARCLRAAVAALAAGGLFLVALLLAPAPRTAAGADAGGQAAGTAVADATGPTVRTTDGPVRGLVKNGVMEFLGIPYAAPPVGDLRWRPPEPHARWRTTLNATAYGPNCAQVTTLGVFAGPASISEDCLYLNVFTTGARRAGAALRPVFVWIHGGGNVDGESTDYDGSKLATGGRYGGSNTVVVTLNYRLGLLGFLAHPALDSEGHPFGNYGIMDIQAALRWVQRNIAAFGGNPNTVALGGQSAGASDTGANVISPLSTGLFQRAIFESSWTSTYPPLSVGLSRGQGFANAAGCSGADAAAAACLRALSVPQILALQGTANANGPYVTGPMVDGTVIPITPEQAWTTGRFNHMPMMGGNVKDERTFNQSITEYFTGSPQTPMTADQYIANVKTAYSGMAGPGGTAPAYPPGTVDKVLAEYPVASYATPQRADDAAFTDPGACRNRHVSNLLSPQVPVYSYQFDYQHAPYYFPAMPGFEPLAAHTIDIQFLFPLWHGGILGVSHPLNADETTLSDQLVAAWTNFARTGNPDRSGNSPWPRFVTKAGPYFKENVPSSTTATDAEFAAEHHCAFWDSLLVY